ncbi:MAG: hypothetical protein HC904_13965 [Blastochloris sp.]|nr:hypothetical protein [Blastochloris sp.]
MKISYPNQRDRELAAREGRKNLGGDIMIHGNRVSIGCLAMGDEVAEDLFILGVLAGRPNLRVLLSPVDFRNTPLPEVGTVPESTLKLYRELEAELKGFSKGGNF